GVAAGDRPSAVCRRVPHRRKAGSERALVADVLQATVGRGVLVPPQAQAEAEPAARAPAVVDEDRVRDEVRSLAEDVERIVLNDGRAGQELWKDGRALDKGRRAQNPVVAARGVRVREDVV